MSAFMSAYSKKDYKIGYRCKYQYPIFCLQLQHKHATAKGLSSPSFELKYFQNASLTALASSE